MKKLNDLNKIDHGDELQGSPLSGKSYSSVEDMFLDWENERKNRSVWQKIVDGLYNLEQNAIDLYWYFDALMRPRHQSLRDAIPKQWTDLDFCIERFMVAAIISFVESEEGLEQAEYQDEGHAMKAAAPMLREAYEYVKVRRPEMQKRVDNYDLKSTKDFNEMKKLEKEIYDLDTKYFTWFVANRELWWT